MKVIDKYGLTQTSAPSVEPLTVDEVRQHLRIDSTDSTDYIEDFLIPAAREYVEDETERQLITATWQLKLPEFPDEGCPIVPPRPNLLTVTSISYYDTDGTSTTLSSTAYSVLTTREPGEIEESTEDSWPSTQTRRDAVTVTYTAGYGATAATVPVKIKQAMLLLIGHWYEHREATSVEVPSGLQFGVDSLLSKYKVRVL